MTKFYTQDSKEITFDFLTKAKVGQIFIDSNEGDAFFGSGEGFEFFLSSVGKEWLKTEKGINKLKDSLRNFVETNKVQSLFCVNDGFCGFRILMSKHKTRNFLSFGEELIDDGNIQFLLSLGNTFFQTVGGRKYLMETTEGKRMLESPEARDWIIRDGVWIFEFWHSTSEEFFDLILETPKENQKKFFASSHIETTFVFDLPSWFLSHGENLFSQKILGESFETFEDYRNHLLGVLCDRFTENDKEIFELADTNDVDDETMIWIVKDFILESKFKTFWLSFNANKEKFKNYFCMNDGKIGFLVLKSLKEQEEKRKSFCKEDFWHFVESFRREKPMPVGWDHSNWDRKLEEDFIGEKEWIKTKEGKEMMSFMGNSFLQTFYGKKWLFDSENEYIYSSEGKMWLLEKGEWVFRFLADFQQLYFVLGDIKSSSFSRDATTHSFLDWVLTTSKSFQQTYWNSAHPEHLICEGGIEWFERCGQDLFESGYFVSRTKKFVGENEVEVIYNSFKEFQEEVSCSII